MDLLVNGNRHPLHIEPRVTLLDALRENIGLTSAKKGCDHGQCGACGVLVDKGIGELGITGMAAAISNAVYHATGKRLRDLPITLDQPL